MPKSKTEYTDEEYIAAALAGMKINIDRASHVVIFDPLNHFSSEELCVELTKSRLDQTRKRLAKKKSFDAMGEDEREKRLQEYTKKFIAVEKEINDLKEERRQRLYGEFGCPACSYGGDGHVCDEKGK